MMLDLPQLETDRLTRRPPQMGDTKPFSDFLASDRSQYVGGPGIDFRASSRAWGHAAGLWLLRGYGPFTFCLKDGTPIGNGGAWFPATWPEPEFGWLIWSGEHEGKGYAREAMEALIPWTWDTLGLTTCTAFIEPANAASVGLAKRLGGVHDTNAPDPFDGDEGEAPVHVYRFFPPKTAEAA
jgi:RimJ/RimL family protein N-acetyltransferase